MSTPSFDIFAIAVDLAVHQKLALDLTRPCLDSPNVADADRKNSEPPEPEDDATGSSK
jgi:hypothetical protein